MRQFTEIQILMARQAKEMQALKPLIHSYGLSSDDDLSLAAGNFFFTQERGLIAVGDVNEMGGTCDCCKEIIDIHKAVWLPLEHQLWEMVRFEKDRSGGEQITDFQLLQGLYFFGCVKLKEKTHTEEFHISRWQLLLEFVYHELYNKVWNGEDWVKA